MRALTIRILAVLLGIAVFVATGEIVVRAIYRDGGRRTLGGPGDRPFEYLKTSDGRRGRFEMGPRRTGTPRIMVLGDSVTWGIGVRDWRDTWPEVLATSLERLGRPHEVAVLAQPGWDIDVAVARFDEWEPIVQPDILIYQWTVNDIEVLANRPSSQRWWQKHASHDRLRHWSYLFFFLDERLSDLLPEHGRSYVDYLLEDFVPGTEGWAEFERCFHNLAARARDTVAARLLVLYPQVPFRGAYPLQAIHDRMRRLAEPHAMTIPPAAWRTTLPLVPDGAAPWARALHVSTDEAQRVLTTAEYYLPAGTTRLTVTVRSAGDGSPPFALELLDPASGAVMATAPVPVPVGGGWQAVPVDLTVPPARGGYYQMSITAAPPADFAVASIDLHQDYGIAVLDLTDDLNTFDTHVSIFDAHPNEAAQRVIASRVRVALRHLN